MTDVLLVDRPRSFRYNGVGRYLIQLTQAMENFTDTPQINMLHFGRVRTFDEWREHILTNTLPPAWYLRLQVALGMGLAMRFSKASVIHYPIGNLYHDWDAGKARRILTLHGMGQYISLPWYDAWQKARAAKLHKRFARGRHKLAHVIAVSEYVKKQAIAALGLPPEKITVVPHGIDFTRFYQETDPQVVTDYLKTRFDLTLPYWFHLSAGGTRKNVLRQIQAFAQLKHKLKLPHQFVLAGIVGDKQIQRIQDCAEQHGVADDVLILGEIQDDRPLRMLYNGADAFLFPSLYEGFGIPIIEAMACGTPVVTSNQDSMPEVSGGAAALVDDPTDVDNLAHVMAQVLEADDYRQQLIERGLRHVQQFTWEQTAQKHIHVYRQAIEGI